MNPPLADFLPTRLGRKTWNNQPLDGLTILLRWIPYGYIRFLLLEVVDRFRQAGVFD